MKREQKEENILKMELANTNKIIKYKKYIIHKHPDPTYKSPFMTTIKELEANNKKIALEIEKNMSCLRTKTCDIEKFKLYITYKNYAINGEFGEIYRTPIFRKYKWYSYIDKERSLDNLLNRIESYLD